MNKRKRVATLSEDSGRRGRRKNLSNNYNGETSDDEQTEADTGDDDEDEEEEDDRDDQSSPIREPGMSRRVVKKEAPMKKKTVVNLYFNFEFINL